MALNSIEKIKSPIIVSQLQLTAGLDAGTADAITAIAPEMMAVRTKKEIIAAFIRFVIIHICRILPPQYSISASRSTTATGSEANPLCQD